jgi:flagellar protein FlaG
VSRERLEDAVRDANENFERLNRRLRFRVHEGTGELMVQIVDRGTGDVLRTNPPEEFLDLAVRMKEMVGFFLDETR